jgi:predicted nucleic acid-binding protein
MKPIFIDTSALYALVSRNDRFHEKAKNIYMNLIDEGRVLYTSAYVLVETIALIHSRLGFEVVRKFMKGIENIIEVIYIDEKLHKEIWRLLEDKEGQISFVDCSTVLLVKQMDTELFAFDEDLKREGFKVLC